MVYVSSTAKVLLADGSQVSIRKILSDHLETGSKDPAQFSFDSGSGDAGVATITGTQVIRDVKHVFAADSITGNLVTGVPIVMDSFSRVALAGAPGFAQVGKSHGPFKGVGGSTVTLENPESVSSVELISIETNGGEICVDGIWLKA